MTEQSWDLTPIYESFESDLFKNDIKKLTELVERLSEKLEKAKNSDIADILLIYIENSNTLGTLESRSVSYTHLYSSFTNIIKSHISIKHKLPPPIRFLSKKRFF